MRIAASALMTRNVLTVGPDWSVEHLMEFLTNHGVSGAPVVTDEGRPIGVVSLTDVVRSGVISEERSAEGAHDFYRRLEDVVGPEESRHFRVEREPGVVVKDIMTPMVFAVEEDTSIQEIAEVMITGRIHRVFVKKDDRLTGVVTTMDLLPLLRDIPISD